MKKIIRNTSAVLIMSFMLIMMASCDMALLSRQGSGKVHLIAVGMDYRNSVSVSNLNGTIADAREVAACLESQYRAGSVPFETSMLLAEGLVANRKDRNYPSAVNVISVIENLKTNPEDLIIFYYSGHGGAYLDDDGNPNGSAFLACAPEYMIPASLYEGGRLREDWYERMLDMGYSATEILDCVNNREAYTELPMDLLFRVMDGKDCRAVALIDCCYAGALADEGAHFKDGWDRAISSTLMKAKSYRRLSVLASSTAYQVSGIGVVPVRGGTERHSLFTRDLLYAFGWTHSLTEHTYGSWGDEVNGLMTGRKRGYTVNQCWETIKHYCRESQQYTPFFSGMDTVIIP